MNSNPSNETTFSFDAISEVIDHLGYSRHSRNMAYLKALFSHTGKGDGYTSSPVNPDLLIQAIWNTTDPDILRSRRKNLSTIRNSINRDLANLFDEGKNPEGVTISPEHALVVSQEAKEALYAPFADILKPSNLPEIEKAGALLEALADMAEKEGRPLEGTDDLAEKLKRALQALEKGGVPPSDEHERALNEDEEVPDEPEEELEIVDEDDAFEEVEDDELEEVLDEPDEELETVDEDDAFEEVEDDELEEILDEPDEELETVDEDDAFEEIKDDELEEVLDEPDEELETVDEDDAFEEVEDDELEEILDESDEELETVDEDDAFEEIEDDELEEVLDESDEELETVDEDDAFEEIEDDELEEVLDESDEELETVDEDDAFEEVEDDELEEVLDEPDEEPETVEEAPPPAPPWASDEDPDAMGERADRFEALLNESERYYNRYIHIPSGRYPAIDPVTGEETEAEIEAFLVGKYPITNALFEVFISRTGYRTTAEERGFGAVYEPRLSRQPNGRGISLSTSRGLRLIRGASWHKPSGTRSSVHTSAHHPVVQVSYEDAVAFASWTGKRLPTLAQWLASGGTSPSPYPWGDAWESHLCNTEEVGAGGTLPVDTFPNGASPFGVHDLMGNAMEWVSDMLPEKGGEPVKIAAGGSFLSDRTLTRQHTHMFDTRFSSNILGFRCVGW
ncbi:hypothetical protein DSLASN_15680 [Desulfoluna limicola]|uniref:Sulfatase-modifying factor enzyme-like domain-containing protein n=1 Tax=Desulfoluna limicola TaxID=2810562 RepID=A0ABN6F1Z4_9BACT|nr:SUMF1/EgtB/PvdO family nonheme iron enzyme [Desulfoluna limicola]BCS95936.1 hypothetical protein DSLASN_15680 [Desulfoluna limicola]